MSKNSSVVYVDRLNKTINKEEWEELRSSGQYCIFREYESEKFAMELEWFGKEVEASVKPIAYWSIYKINVFNVVSVGRPGAFIRKKIEDPCLSRSGIYHQKDAVEYYEKILYDKGLLLTEEDYEGNVEYIEIGNWRTTGDISYKKQQVKPEEIKKERDTAFGSW
jgi:hypothetical protein